MKLIIDPELQTCIPPLSSDELAGLEADIFEAGKVRIPIEIWDDIIIDGHNRYAIASKHNIPFTTVSLDLESKTHAKIYIRKNNLHRRNLSDGWKIELALLNKEDLLKVGRENMSKGGQNHQGNQYSGVEGLSKNDKPSREHNAQKAIAQELGFSTGKVAQAEYVKNNAPELWEKVKGGVKTVGGAYKATKKAKEREIQIEALKTYEPPTGKHHVIVIDPPWQYENRASDSTHRAANPYPSMKLEEIMAMPIPDLALDDCILWLWTTNAFMEEAHQVIKEWGFVKKTILTWVKDKIGLGDWLRGQTEHCLMCVRGKPIVNLTNQSTVIYGSSREHSRKPDEFYTLIEDLCPGSKLELFTRKEREGWNNHGIEFDKFA